ncbi:hypothetical protein [Lysobacter sp. Root494]|uniref:hypothetical protein n=1 Tax=Lysobacter sp. Root494 TaxID=1736549 RepID=UPI0006FD7CE9|nr:hypothetical protein [Lysobacter sp. Root494]KQY52643.1 hypothetical protein ASD14_08665 [Lysobacter sp. Root494]
MAQANLAAYEQYGDEALMHRYFELSEHAEEHADELAAIDAVIQSRLFATYGAATPGSSPRIRIAA